MPSTYDSDREGQRLEKYLLTAAASIAAGTAAGQILYTDIQPDVYLDMNPFIQFDLDIDQDGQTDVSLYGNWFQSSWYYTYTTSYGSTFMSSYFRSYRYWRMKGSDPLTDKVAIGGLQWWELEGFLAGDTINDNPYVPWVSSGDAWYFDSVGNQYGDWTPSGGDLFAGIRLTRNGQFLYGWVRMEQLGGVPHGQLVVKDMAIDTTGSFIAAGDTVTANTASLERWEAGEWNAIFRNGLLELSLLANGMDAQFVVLDQSGRALERGSLKPGELKRIGALDWPQGVYIVALRNQKGISRRRIILR